MGTVVTNVVGGVLEGARLARGWLGAAGGGWFGLLGESFLMSFEAIVGFPGGKSTCFLLSF